MMTNLRRLLLGLILCFLGYYTFTTYQSVETVLSYRPMVRQILADQDSRINEDLILAMIYTESKGKGQDVLQASESSTGSVGNISSQEDSLKQGIGLLSSNLQVAAQEKTDTWTAIQAYNFGPAYITYVAKNGGVNTISLATTYSRDVVAPSLGNTTGKTYRYYHPIALIYGGGELYEDGGNIYYAQQVKLNLAILTFLGRFITN